MILGYSIWSHDRAMSSVEVNHVVASSAGADHPAGVSTRTILGDGGPDDPLKLHAPSYLTAFDPRREIAGTDRAARDRLSREIASIGLDEASLLVDGEAVSGEGFVWGRWCFWKAVREEYVWTVAAPSDIAAAGFATSKRPLRASEAGDRSGSD
ncbi:hypothetical protein N1028_18620 [Herbiconiux sp. CPCC 203407]|uniref:Uncharacterized protein n=1 Tax=Herbiconiux oxytropis TaxID=2970915 RepID=A0AA41XKV4_9MICO|nr:hypothetical protein [Herbiconiux oxytropis]MCS5723261.1 hypothetical protein [Herbiconiux oxytropis]MCS5727916.1 hypothetical protein [Herbiconiux oxytropis]